MKYHYLLQFILGLLWITTLPSIALSEDDSKLLLKLAKREPTSFVSLCADNRDSLAKIFIEKHEWEPSQAEPEFSNIRKITAKTGDLEIVSLNSGSSLPSLEYAYFFMWAKGTSSCAIELRLVPPSSNNLRLGIQEIELSSTSIENVYQIQVTMQTEMINSDAENPDTSFRRHLAKDQTIIELSKKATVKILAAEIPVYDSGDGTHKKSKPRELMLQLNSTGTLEITAKTAVLAKQQKPWIGKYRINFESISNALQSDKGANEPGIDVAYKIAITLFKAGRPGPAADTLSKALSISTELTAVTIPIANDLGFFLVEAKRYLEGSKVLEKVLAADSTRTVAYLNLGDAYAGAGKTEEARQNYRKYCDRMQKIGKGAKIPPRIKLMLEN